MRVLKWLRKADPGNGIMTLGWIFLILLFFGIIVETGNMYLTHNGLESKLQRAANTTIEYAMMDDYRADGILRLDTALAHTTLNQYLQTDMGLDGSGVHRAPDGTEQYKITISQTEITAEPPAIKLSGEMEFNTVFSFFSETGKISFPFEITSKNYSIR